MYDSKLQAKCFPKIFGKPPTLAAQIDKVSKRWEKEVSAPQKPARAHDIHTLCPLGNLLRNHMPAMPESSSSMQGFLSSCTSVSQ